MIAKLTLKSAKIKYKGKTVHPQFLPWDSVPYEFEPFSKEELYAIERGETDVIISKPLAAAGQAQTHVIALSYVGSKRLQFISIHKGNPVTVKSVARAFMLSLKISIHELDDLSIRNGAPTNKAIAIAKLTPKKIDDLIEKLAEKYD